jgi:uncharacterized membrane protein HdeD (DUF308 family)
MEEAHMTTLVQTWPQEAKKNAGWLMFLGIVEIVAGVLSVMGPLVAGLTVAVVVGWMLVVGGFTRVVGAFKADSFGGGTLTFLWGLLYVVAGFYFVTQPGIGLASLTLLVTMVLFAEGLVRAVLAFQMRPAPRWGWMLAGGVLSVLFAVMLWRQLPASSLWFVGTLVGFSLITNGFTTTGVASAARKIADAA